MPERAARFQAQYPQWSKLFDFFNVPEPWTLANWRSVLADDFFDRALLTTLRIAVSSGWRNIALSSKLNLASSAITWSSLVTTKGLISTMFASRSRIAL